MDGHTMSTRVRFILLAGLCVCQTLTGGAHAADSSEFWPEVNAIVRQHPRVPYVKYEWFYDTRYDGWARTLWMVGAEIATSAVGIHPTLSTRSNPGEE
jgi:hypothetical protein